LRRLDSGMLLLGSRVLTNPSLILRPRVVGRAAFGRAAELGFTLSRAPPRSPIMKGIAPAASARKATNMYSELNEVPMIV
jgi:hypothetical protein